MIVSSNPTGGNFIILFFKTLGVNIVQKCQICVENEKPEWLMKLDCLHSGIEQMAMTSTL